MKYIGTQLNGSICDYLSEMHKVPKSMRYALITSLDSEINPASFLENNKLFDNKDASALGLGIFLPTEMLMQDKFFENIFFGFDEIWFFPEKINNPKPNDLSIVSPIKASDDIVKKAEPWMRQTNCSMGLGDGNTLNAIMCLWF